MTDLLIDDSDFYITAEHRHAELYITGGTDGESVELTVLDSSIDDGQDDVVGHLLTWKNIASGNSTQKLIFTNKTIFLVDNCITSKCVHHIDLLFKYHDREYEVTLNIDVTN